jgi:hypothetical protein
MRMARLEWEFTAALTMAALIVGTPVSAHHSFAMFDPSKKVTLEGTVRDWQWTNPHIFLELTVDEAGATHYYSIEATSPTMARAKLGWERDMLKAGDKVTVVMSPLKDGRRGGALVSVAKNGVVFRAEAGAPKPAPAPGS